MVLRGGDIYAMFYPSVGYTRVRYCTRVPSNVYLVKNSRGCPDGGGGEGQYDRRIGGGRLARSRL